MNWSEDLEKLVREVAYTFYTGEATMVLTGFLDLGRQVSAEELSKHLKFSKAELSKVLGRLKTDGLISDIKREDDSGVDNPDELTAAQRRKLIKDYYFLDYKSFIDSVNLKIHLIKRELAKQCGPEEQIFYECPKCKALDDGRKQTRKKYIYDLKALSRAFRDDDDCTLKCPDCQTPMEKLDEKEDINKKKRIAKEFDELVEPLIKIIDSTQGLVIIDDADKRCKADELMPKQVYVDHTERIRQEKQRIRNVGKSSSSHSARIDANGKVDIKVRVDDTNLKKVRSGDSLLKELERKAVEKESAPEEVKTITINGKAYTAEEITQELLDTLDDSDWDRAMDFKHENE